MKLTAETVTKDNVIEYLERKDIDNIGVNEYKEEIVFDDFYECFEFKKNYENQINKNRDEDESKGKDKAKKKKNTLIDVILSSSVLPFIVLAIIWLLLLCVHLLFNTDPAIFLVLFIIGPVIYGMLEIMIMD